MTQGATTIDCADRLERVNRTAPLRIGVIGAGIMGGNHIPRITSNIAGAEVAAVIEPDATRAEEAFADAHRASVFSTFESALHGIDLDAVIVAVERPAFYHPS